LQEQDYGAKARNSFELTFDDAALVAMVNLPMVGGAQACRVLDAVFPAFGKWARGEVHSRAPLALFSLTGH
jgi:hypothetical protein